MENYLSKLFFQTGLFFSQHKNNYDNNDNNATTTTSTTSTINITTTTTTKPSLDVALTVVAQGT